MKNITVYSSDDCVQCKATKKYLDRMNVEYKIIDVVRGSETHAYLKSLNYANFPVVSTDDGVMFSGFIPEKLKQLIS